MLIHFLLVSIFGNAIVSAYKQPKLVKIGIPEMKSWGYDDVSLCQIVNSTRSDNRTTDVLHDACLRQFQLPLGTPRPHHMHGLEQLAYGASIHREICSDEVPLSERGFDEVVEGFEKGNENKHLLQTFLELSARNMSFLTMGDSINNQVLEAMKFELDRCDAGTFKYNIASELRWLAPEVLANINFPPNELRLLEVLSWTPNENTTLRGAPLNPVIIYAMQMRVFDGSLTYMRICKRLVTHLLQTGHPNGMLIIANNGHHLGDERNSYFNGNPLPLYERINSLLTYLHELHVINPNAVVAFRETTPSHFNSPLLDGSYERYMASPAAQSMNFLQPNGWDHSLYYCRRIHNLSNPEVSQIPENLIARSIIKGWLGESYLHILQAFKYLAPFYKLKFGNCGYGGRIYILDCVHYIANHPPMWAPVWKELLVILQQSTNTASTAPSFQSLRGRQQRALMSTSTPSHYIANAYPREIVSWKASHPWQATTLVSNGTDIWYLRRGIMLHRIDPELYRSLFKVAITSVPCINMTTSLYNHSIVSFDVEKVHNSTVIIIGEGYFVVFDGVLHPIRYWETYLSLQLSQSKHVVHSASPGWIDALPLGGDLVIPAKNATLYTLGGNTLYYYLSDQMRFVPSLVVVNQLFNLSLTNKDAVRISESTLYDYKFGPWLPISNQTLIVFKGGFYYYVNDMLRWIPDMDTFYYLHLRLDQGVTLPATIFNQLACGPPWPKCHC